MSKTFEEYDAYWRDMQKPSTEIDSTFGWVIPKHPQADFITPTSCILTGSDLHSAPGMSDSFWLFNDFGDAIGYFGYWELPRRYKRPPELSPEQDLARRHEAIAFFLTLLKRYVHDGYQPEMKDDLCKGVHQYIRDIWLEEVYILPQDVTALLDYSGNPFKSRWGDDEDDGREEDREDEEDESYKAAFDLNNPDHCYALYKRLNDLIS